jgi:hypothetical protein
MFLCGSPTVQTYQNVGTSLIFFGGAAVGKRSSGSVFPPRGPPLDIARIYLQMRLRLTRLVERAHRLNSARRVILRLREKVQRAEASIGLARADLIRKSSICFPDLSSKVSQRGCLPRPDHVSNGSSGFRHFGG